MPSLFAASILPISTAYTVCGAWVRIGRGQDFRKLRFFYWLYSLLIVGGAATVLPADAQLIQSVGSFRRY